ncbi:MAG: sensor protein [Amycolatopsis sp.]|jgi:sigma-B regulation protein RsbU (phosphoserine phosphatase)|uniref:PP2C family protein-serine/threonine phosphatase n=1 Tax=Amycolatopsis sp. TaxID=37632 RepID=UPI002621747E|nr:PP2C family protein-serine/threonine phosphatase [Amycolatopsis sp.]MCU1679290.1 sensor protein [Amycolatopsis sp.]
MAVRRAAGPGEAGQDVVNAEAAEPQDLPETGSFWRELLADVRDAVVLQDAAARVRWFNPAAYELFTLLHPGDWPEAGHDLEELLDPGVDGAPAEPIDGSIEYAGHRLPVRCRTIGQGWRIWTFFAPAEAGPVLDLQPQWDAFLAGTYARLIGAQDRDATAGLVAELAAGELADCAIVVLPLSRGRWEWWGFEAGSTASRGKVRRVRPAIAPIFTEAVSGAVGHSTAVELSGDEVLGLPSALVSRLGQRQSVSVASLTADGGGVPGAVVFGCTSERPVPGGEWHRAIGDFARRAGEALAAAERFGLQKEATEGLKTTLRPRLLPELRGARTAVWYEPSSGALDVGGDFYDLHPRADGSALLVLGDICGNGAEAAALTGRVRHTLAALHLVERDGRQLLDKLNEALIAAGSSRFATLVVGSVVPGRDGLLLTLASGGHPAPLVLRRTGEVEEVVLPGMLVGISPHARFAEASVDLANGDMCLLYTDGITEARGDHDRTQLYGQERLIQLLAGCVDFTADEVVERVRADVRAWLGDIEHDDIALLAIHSVPPAENQ